MFKLPQDRLPVALILGLSVFDFAAYLFVDRTWVLATIWLALLIPKGVIGAWNHHHQHVNTFRGPWLNRVYEQFLALHTGITSNLWVLHHNLGHHLNFLDQTKDESRWRRQSGQTMGAVEYTLSIATTAYFRAFQVGRRFPNHQRIYVRGTIVTILLVAALVWYRPLPALFLFVLPMVSSLLFTAWVTYDHHSGLDSADPFEASYNIMNPVFNKLTGNLGYHTAHHHRQAVHWSKLPALHATIETKIPTHLYRKSTFDVFLPAEATSAPRVQLPEVHAVGLAASDPS